MKENFLQLHLGDAEKGLSLIAAHIRITPKELSERVGIRFEITCDDLDYMEAALIELANGRRICLFRYQRAPIQRYTAIVIDVKTENITAAVNEALASLGLETRDVISFDQRYRFDEQDGGAPAL